ncbi:MAG: helix-turn-helix transcriptional regulator [Actinomycetales bacterium]|nr:helix-turn-helix transcriptional regulator [Actinomycetales bacterium]
MNLDELFESIGHDSNHPDAIAAGEDFDNFEDFIHLLYEKRRAAGLTQKAVAKIMGTHQSVISDFELMGGNPRIDTIQSYARAVGYRVLLELAPTTPVTQDITATA